MTDAVYINKQTQVGKSNGSSAIARLAALAFLFDLVISASCHEGFMSFMTNCVRVFQTLSPLNAREVYETIVASAKTTLST